MAGDGALMGQGLTALHNRPRACTETSSLTQSYTRNKGSPGLISPIITLATGSSELTTSTVNKSDSAHFDDSEPARISDLIHTDNNNLPCTQIFTLP